MGGTELRPAGEPALPRSPRWFRWAALLAASAAALVGGLSGHASQPPLALDTYVGQFQAGPASTALNHGYGSLDDLATVPTPSYRTTVAPKALGMQFLNVSRATLAGAHFVMYAHPPRGRWRAVPVVFGADGFVGYRPAKPLTRGAWQFRLESQQLGVFPPWTVTVAAERPLPAPTRAGMLALAFLNAARAEQGSPAVQWSARLSLASLAHARYVAHLGYHDPSFHVERPGPFYTGRFPWDRDLAAGWPDTSTGEVGIGGPSSVPGPLFIGELLDTVYHRLGLLSPNAYAVGYGAAAGPKANAEIMDIAYGYRSTLPRAVAYPRPGATGVATAWTDLESPSPVPHGAGQVFGYPITLDCPTVARLRQASADLTLPSGAAVPAVLDRPGTGGLAPNQLALVPREPLAPDTTYVVTVESAVVQFNDGHVGSLTERWSFRTGSGAQSVYAATQGRRLDIAVDEAGVGAPAPETVRVTLAQGNRRIHLAARVVHGLAHAQLPAHLAGRWQITVVTPHGNSGRTTWQAS